MAMPDPRRSVAAREHEVRRIDHSAFFDVARAEARVPRLAGQRGVVRQQIVTLDEARVGRHAVAFGEQKHVARNEILDGTSCSTPPRRTVMRWGSMLRSACIARSARIA